jgi:hypothetical protein
MQSLVEGKSRLTTCKTSYGSQWSGGKIIVITRPKGGGYHKKEFFMKRTLIIVTLIAAILAPLWAQDSGTTPDGFAWYKQGNGIVIEGYKGTATAVRIPDRINNLPVVGIDDAFNAGGGNTMITSVVIPNTVTVIGTTSFSDQTRLTSVTLPTSLTEIGQQAFIRCSSLTSISLPASIKTIGNSAFRYCTALTNVTIPSSVTSITFGTNVFQNITNLNAATVQALTNRGYKF